MYSRFLKDTPWTVNMQSLQHQRERQLFHELLPIFTELLNLGTNYKKAPKLAKQVDAVVLDRLNMKTTLTIDTENITAAHMHIPHLGNNNVLLNRATRQVIDNKELKKHLKERMSETQGGVDTKTGRVFGFLEKINIKITIGTDLACRQGFLTAEEVTAIYLHELGHGWTFFYMLGGTLRTNVVIHAAMYDYQFGEDKARDTERLFILEGATGVKIDNKTVTSKNGNEAVSISLIQQQVAMQRSEFGASGFDNSSAEAIADQFVARQGAGVHVITGLDKLGRDSLVGPKIRTLMSVLKVLATLKLYGAPLLISIFLTDPTTGTYDDPYKRAKRVREQIVASLKDKNLSKEQRRTRIEEIAVIDEVMDGIEDNEPFFDFLWRRVIEGGNKHVKAKVNQEMLESIINNDLYVLGSVLSTKVKS